MKAFIRMRDFSRLDDHAGLFVLPMVNFAIGSAYLTAAFPEVPHGFGSFCSLYPSLSSMFRHQTNGKYYRAVRRFQVIVALTLPDL
ncbi:hypothetical protein PO124_03150 [Bacillus licheniformis]|nr:hypothetical protein [Bacillus licheniformis]